MTDNQMENTGRSSYHYEKALVLVKPLPTTTSNFETVHTYHLRGKLLKADGTLSEPITRLDLRNGEAAILIGAKSYGKAGKPELMEKL